MYKRLFSNPQIYSIILGILISLSLSFASILNTNSNQTKNSILVVFLVISGILCAYLSLTLDEYKNESQGNLSTYYKELDGNRHNLYKAFFGLVVLIVLFILLALFWNPTNNLNESCINIISNGNCSVVIHETNISSH